MVGFIWTICVLLVAFWVAGLVLHIGGSLIHIALVVAVALVIFNMMTGRGARV